MERGGGEGLAEARTRGAACVALGAAILSVFILSTGCTAIPVNEQGLSAKRNMSFDEELVSSLDSGIRSQIETGAESGSGGQSAGCIACR